MDQHYSFRHWAHVILRVAKRSRRIPFRDQPTRFRDYAQNDCKGRAL